MSTIGALKTRPIALSLYRRIFRTARTWGDAQEADYIRNEARSLFHENQNINDEDVIADKIFEAESRLDLALHYKIPYPRLFNVSPNTVQKVPKTHKKIIPAYMDTYYRHSP